MHALDKYCRTGSYNIQEPLTFTLFTVDSNLPFYLWDRLLNQFTMKLNMLRQSLLNPKNQHMNRKTV